MDHSEEAARIFSRAVMDLASRGLLDSGDRWADLAAMAEALPQVVRQGGLDPLDAVLLFLVHGLERFPDAVPLEEESYHAHAVQVLMSKLHETLLVELDRKTGMDFREGPPR